MEIFLGREEEWVPANTPIVLRIGWATDTPEQVVDFLASVELEVTLDGEPLVDPAGHWGDIEEFVDYDEDGDMDYHALWLYPVGLLSQGTHRVESGFCLQRSVTDGFDSDGDGVADQFSGTWGYSLQIVVGE